MTREPEEPLRLDYLIKAGTIHSMTGETYRAVGVRGPEIVALSAEPGGLDDLAWPTGTSSVLRLASIRCSCESAKAGSRVRSPASTTAVSYPARSSSPAGSADTATISGPRTPIAR